MWKKIWAEKLSIHVSKLAWEIKMGSNTILEKCPGHLHFVADDYQMDFYTLDTIKQTRPQGCH